MRVVLDTNILVSGSIYDGNESLALDEARHGNYSLYVSQHILDEFSRVMPRRFNWTMERLQFAISELLAFATLIDPPPLSSSPTGHPPDDLVLACVAAADADFLVTGDRRHLLPLRRFGSARIVTAAEFLEELETAEP